MSQSETRQHLENDRGNPRVAKVNVVNPDPYPLKPVPLMGV
jgi:hypothetical protein